MNFHSHNRNQTISKFYNSRFNNVEDNFSILKIKSLSKYKKIHKCQITTCRQHRFTLRKVSNQCQEYTLIKKIEDVDITFCPKEFFGMISGGFPVFNFDGKIETPAFQAKYELSNTSGNVLYSEKFLKQKQKMEKQNLIVEQHPSIKFGVSQRCESKIFNQLLIAEFQEILKQKNKQQNNIFQ